MNDATIVDVSTRELDIDLREPFGIATGVQERVRNVLVRVRLAGGAEGWGEAAPFHAVTGETYDVAKTAIEAVTPALAGRDARAWRTLGRWLGERLERAASARCAIETAALDALARFYGIPLWVLFGGASSSLKTDMTITTGTPEAARDAAKRIARGGYATIKLKVGGCPLEEDTARLRAVTSAAPSCGLVLDANGAMGTPDEALRLLDSAKRAGGQVVLFEQPLARENFDGAREIIARTAVPVAADEGAVCVADVHRLALERAAQVVNIKIMKSGLVEALDMISAAKTHGLGLMVGGMVESSMAMTTSACLAAGQGGFEFVDLDTPMFLVDQPFEGGYASGPRIDLAGIRAGHGVTPRPKDALSFHSKVKSETERSGGN